MLVMGAPLGFGVREKRSKRVKGVIIKRTVGALESRLLLRFLGEQKMKDRASAEKYQIRVRISNAIREIGVIFF